MKTEYVNIKGEVKKCRVFSYDEIESIFNDKDWNRTFKDRSFLEKAGLTASPETFLVAGSTSATPTEDGKVAGICTLRTDEKDRPKGFPINWNHWDFFQLDGKIVMIPSDDKRSDHWFKSEEDWKCRIKNYPPHEDKII